MNVPAEYGIVYDVYDNPRLEAISKSAVKTQALGEVINADILVTELSPNTTYYLCPYVQVSADKYFYGSTVKVTTGR